MFRRRNEQKVTETEQAGTGVDVGQLEITSLLEQLGGITYDASSGEVSNEELVKKARASEMETLNKHKVYTKVPLGPWRSAGELRARNQLDSSGWT